MSQPKKKGDPISIDGVKEYVDRNTDFSFEMRVLKTLNDLGLSCKHGGTYEDPITKKARQYDIHASRDSGSNQLLLAVECKNLTEAYPLIVQSVPRPSEDAFHEVFVRDNIQFSDSAFETRATSSFWRTVRVKAPRSPYETLAYVGKSMDQIGYDKDGQVQGKSSDVFEKFSQAVNSAAELIKTVPTSHYSVIAVVPFLVVPDGMLWEVPYSKSGKPEGEPHRVNRIQYLLRQNWVTEAKYGSFELTLSHIEIATITGLPQALNALTRESPHIFL